MDYFLSLAEELNSQASRVRQLIGSAHWGQDGRHKEALLRELIRRHSPASILVTSGFLVSPNNVEVRSLEQDILLIDTSTEAPLFNRLVRHERTMLTTFGYNFSIQRLTTKDELGLSWRTPPLMLDLRNRSFAAN
jgi:hypothetical protein